MISPVGGEHAVEADLFVGSRREGNALDSDALDSDAFDTQYIIQGT